MGGGFIIDEARDRRHGSGHVNMVGGGVTSEAGPSLSWSKAEPLGGWERLLRGDET